MEPGLAFAGSPPMLYVLEPVWNATWGKWFLWYLPSFGAAVLLMTLALTVWWIRRVWVRPRVAGQMYCRGCNHQLARPQLKLNEKKRAVWADAESKCPECGVRHKRGPVRGRARWVRLLIPALVSPMVMFVCALVLVATLKFFIASPWGSSTWPAMGVERVIGSWALERRAGALFSQSLRLLRVDPETGKADSLGIIDKWVGGGLEFVTPSGEFVVIAMNLEEELLVIDTRSGDRKSYSLAERDGEAISAYVLQFGRDGNSAFINRNFVESSGKLMNELVKFEPRSGRMETVGTVEEFPAFGGRGTHTNGHFELMELPDRVRWVHVTSRTNTSGRGEEIVLRWMAGRMLTEWTETTANGSFSVDFSADGSRCLVNDFVAGSTVVFDMESGQKVDAPATKRRERPEPWGPRISYAGPGRAEVRAMGGGRDVVGSLAISNTGMTLAATHDGRFAAAFGVRDVEPSWLGRLLGVPSTPAAEVRVWDFEKLLDAETEKAVQVGK